jgi:hypothetical protein
MRGYQISLSILMMVIIASSMVTETSGSSQALQTISSSGLISYSTPFPSPTPSPTSGSLPNSALGNDYLIWYNWNGDPSAWDSQLHWFTDYHCTAARLAFSFSDDTGSNKDSTYVKSKLDMVLTKFNSVGVKVILCNFAGENSHFYGSTAWINDWKQLTNDFKGDARIKAFEIANEPYANYLASSATTMSGFNAACASLIDQIRAIDPSRTIMYPIVVNIMEDNPTAFYNDLVAKGIPAKGNIMYDIVHPYYFETSADMGMTPTQKADWYWNNIVQPQIAYFGVQNCWCGEMFCWPRGEGYNYSLQQQFVVRMINHFVDAGMGFQMWCFISSSDRQAQIDALNASNY